MGWGGVLWVAVAGCIEPAPADPPDPPDPPIPPACGQRAEGSLALEIGTGATEFIAVDETDPWLAARGPQGGEHIWLSIRATGLGSPANLRFRYEELDAPEPIAVFERPCLELMNDDEEGWRTQVGVTVFVPSTEPLRTRILCGPAFRLVVEATDDSGAVLIEAESIVSHVELDPDDVCMPTG